VIAIEPNPSVVPRLRKNLEQNGLAERVTIIAAGLSDHPGIGRLYVGSNSTIGTLVVADGQGAMGTAVELVRLDDILDDADVPSVDLLKVDVEGSEQASLRGAASVLRRTRRAVVEVSHRADVPGVIRACEDAGFEEIEDRASGSDSGASIVFARRLGGSSRL
jgi:FkbM family methyltransferase